LPSKKPKKTASTSLDGSQDIGETQYVIVLEIPLVVSLGTAVQTAIVSGFQKWRRIGN
jgi:hypothetical protein